MADERTTPRAAPDTTVSDTSAMLTAEQRAQLRERSAEARSNARAAAARCLELRMKFEASVAAQAEWRESLTRVLPALRESVGHYARCLREEGAPPEQMLMLVKEALHEALPSSVPASSAILDMSVGCAIEAYYDLTAA